MLIEAILTVCLSTPINDWKGDLDSGPTCVSMNTGDRTFETLGQCEFWLKQGDMEVSTRQHRDAIHRRLPWTTIEKAHPVITGECRIIVFKKPYVCRDCES